MKILLLVNWKIEYAKTTPKDKQPPDYYVKGEPYWFFRYFKSKNIQVDVVDVSSFSILERFEKNIIRFYVWQTLKVLPILKNYDMVISHGMQSGIVLCLLRRIFGKGEYKHIVFDIGAFNSAKGYGKSLKLMQFASKSLDGVIYHTKSQIDYYKEFHPWLISKSKYIVFGTDSYFFNMNSICNTGNNTQKYILCIGYNKRDWDTLINAYTSSTQKYKLMLVGNDNIKVDNKNIYVRGNVNINELKEIISKAEFCILPLKYMNYSFGQMTLLQQMAMGKAVIAANVPSLQAYFKSDNVLQYVPEDIDDLKDKIEKLYVNQVLKDEIGMKAEKYVKTEFNEKKMSEEIEEYLLSCL